MQPICRNYHDSQRLSVVRVYMIYLIILQSTPHPNTADLGTDGKAAIFGNRRYWESYLTYKTLIWDLEMGGGIGGGGNGRGGIGGTTVFRMSTLIVAWSRKSFYN